MARVVTGPLKIKATGRSLAASPLRYPGGKVALARFFSEIIERIGITEARYVEPYAGGVGAGIALLKQDIVQELVINDIDPAVYCFWRSIVDCSDAFASLVATTPLTVEEWRHQKEVYRTADERNPLALGFAFFFLNRTNRSGILNAGPIGGITQTGNYKIDARFNRDQLAGRISSIGSLASRITVTSVDGRATVERYAGDASSFLYIDPPYVDMGGTLYLNAFTHRDHAELAQTLDGVPDGNWVVTYDTSDFIRRLYRNFDIREYQLHYSARRTGKTQELMIASQTISRVLD